MNEQKRLQQVTNSWQKFICSQVSAVREHSCHQYSRRQVTMGFATVSCQTSSPRLPMCENGCFTRSDPVQQCSPCNCLFALCLVGKIVPTRHCS